MKPETLKPDIADGIYMKFQRNQHFFCIEQHSGTNFSTRLQSGRTIKDGGPVPEVYLSLYTKDPLPGRTRQPSCTGLNNPVFRFSPWMVAPQCGGGVTLYSLSIHVMDLYTKANVLALSLNYLTRYNRCWYFDSLIRIV